MRSMVSKKSLIMTIIIFLVLTLVATVTSYFLGVSTARGASVKQYILAEDVDAGHSLKGKYVEAYVPEQTSLDMKHLVLDESVLDSYVAAYDLKKNSYISTNSLVKLEELERNFEVAIPITVEGSVGNSVKAGDVVAIKLTYSEGKQDDAVVVPQITVKDIRSTNGSPIVDDTSVAGFVIFDVTNEEQSLIKNALKEGALYCAKYKNLDKGSLEQTYFISDNSNVGN